MDEEPRAETLEEHAAVLQRLYDEAVAKAMAIEDPVRRQQELNMARILLTM